MADYFAIMGDAYGKGLYELLVAGIVHADSDDLSASLRARYRRAACRLIDKFVTEAQLSIGDREVVIRDPVAFRNLMDKLKEEWDHGTGVYFIP